MQLIDIFIILLASLAVLRGYETGIIRQTTTLLGLIAGIFVGSIIANLLNGDIVLSILIVLVCIIPMMSATELIGNKLTRGLRVIKLNPLNHAVGAGVGLVAILIVVWLGSSIISAIPSTQLRTSIRDSKVIIWLDDTLPPASRIVAWLDSSLSKTNLPNSINQLEQNQTQYNSPAELPNVNQFGDIIAKSQDSIVEIEGRSCNGFGVGTGFVSKSSDIIITNAHVVAGMRNPYVESDGKRIKTEIIGFNPGLDIAVLKADGLNKTPLELLGSTTRSGAYGVVIGYPEGGPQASSTALVMERFLANGKDIYGEKFVQKDVYALKTNVQPGNSGGPLINKTGKVIGVIFAKSTQYENIGYALTTPDVLGAVNRSLSNPNNQGSLRCADI